MPAPPITLFSHPHLSQVSTEEEQKDEAEPATAIIAHAHRVDLEPIDRVIDAFGKERAGCGVKCVGSHVNG